STPSAAIGRAKPVMTALCWPAPAPCASISVAPARSLPMEYTNAVVTASGGTWMRSSLGFFKSGLDLGIRLEVVGDRHHAELRRQRPREHPIDIAVHDAGERHDAVANARADVVEDRELRIAVHALRDVVEHLTIFPRGGVGEGDARGERQAGGEK